MINVGLLPEGAGNAGVVTGRDLQAWNLNVYRAAWRALTDVRPIGPGSRVLEIGCGQGVGLRYLADQSQASVTGVDLSIVATLLARRAGLAVRRASTHALPFADASFDAVFMIEALFVFAGWARALPEVRRVLTPGGHLVTAEFTSMTIDEARNAVAQRAEAAGFSLVALDDHSSDARRAVLEGEAARARYLRNVPRPIAVHFRDALGLKGSERYASWQQSRQSYYIATLRAVQGPKR